MQLGRQFIPTAAKFDHVFSKNMKRNRVELVSDFPNDAEVISSLQVCILMKVQVTQKWNMNSERAFLHGFCFIYLLEQSSRCFQSKYFP